MHADSFPHSAGRRAVLKGGTLMLASAALGSKQIAANESQPAVRIGDIHYCTLVAMVEGDGLESNGYSVLECRRDGTLSLTGFRKQSSYQLS